MSTPSENDYQQSLSKRGWGNVATVMPRIGAAVKDRIEQNSSSSPIDLSTSENELLRPELIDLCKISISENLESKASRLVLLRELH